MVSTEKVFQTKSVVKPYTSKLIDNEHFQKVLLTLNLRLCSYVIQEEGETVR